MSVSVKRLFAHSAFLIASFFLAILPARAGQAAAAPQTADLSRFVVVGDSLSAGFQNFSLYDSDNVAPPGGQTHGFAALIAQQANVNLNLNVSLPLIQYPGIPPVLSLGPDNTVTRGTTIGTREPQTLPVQTFNLSVPGFTVSDSLLRSVNVANVQQNPSTANPVDVLTLEVLGFPSLTPGSTPCGVFPFLNGDVFFSAAACALQLQPTTILVSIGNGDVLQTLTNGNPPTDLATFSAAYSLLLTALSQSHARIVVSNIFDVTATPFLLSVQDFEARCGGVPPVGAGPTDYIVPNIESLSATSFNVCTDYEVRPAARIAQAQTAVHDYNIVIAANAAQFGAVVVDVNKLFAGIAKDGYDVAGHHLTTQYLGGIFSLDAVHPTNTGYAILANAFIDRMNCELHTNIPRVDIEQIAATDPLVLPNPGQ
jgi:hypothetical protein